MIERNSRSLLVSKVTIENRPLHVLTPRPDRGVDKGRAEEARGEGEHTHKKNKRRAVVKAKAGETGR
jgi:hypothetical protein